MFNSHDSIKSDAERMLRRAKRLKACADSYQGRGRGFESREIRREAEAIEIKALRLLGYR